MKLNEKIYHCRKRASLSQDALAEKLGVSRQAISKWETGESVPDTGKLYPLSQALGVSLDWLLSEDEPEDAGAVKGEYDAGAFVPGQGAAAATAAAKPKGFWQGFKHWCWLSGVIIAAIGAYLSYQAALAKLAVSKLMGLVNIDGGLMDTDISLNGVETNIGELMANNPVSIISTAQLIVGVILIVVGVILAVVLKRKFAK